MRSAPERCVVVALTLAMAACSAVPDFKPTRPIEEASSVEDAVSLCAEYEIHGELNASGAPLPARVPVLTPWIRCLETVFRRMPAARENRDLVMLLRAVESKHDRAQPPDAAVIDWPAMNFAMSHALSHVLKPKTPFTPKERSAITSQLPDYAVYLYDHAGLDIELSTTKPQPLQTAIDEAMDLSRGSPRAAALAPRQKEYCRRYRAYVKLSDNLNDLRVYERVLSEQTYADAGNADETNQRQRVRARVDSLTGELRQSERSLKQELIAIQSSSRWFKNGYCLQ